MAITRAIIPLAGLATRFLPITKSIPKEILPIGQFPVIHWVVRELIDAGIKQILFITSNRDHVIERYFSHDPWLEGELAKRNKSELLHEIDFLLDRCTFFYAHQTKPAGIADAIYLGKDFVYDESFFCHMGDSFFRDGRVCKKMIENHEKHNASCTITMRETEKSLVTVQAHVITEKHLGNDVFTFSQYIEKPDFSELTSNLGVIGRYIFQPYVFEIIHSLVQNKALVHERDFSKLMNNLLERAPGIAIKSSNEMEFYNAGDLEDYSRAFIKFYNIRETSKKKERFE